MKPKYILITVVAIVLLLGLVWAIAPLFHTVKLDEAAPGAGASVASTPGAVVVGTSGHPASGTARIIASDGVQYVRYENFKTINGPDIYVYLSKDLGATDFVSLGAVKATEGNVNYAIPATTSVTDYRYVLTWCKAFGVLFNYADFSTMH